VVCTDGTIHEKKFGIPVQRRRDESIAAAKILGVEVKFLGIPEEKLTVTNLVRGLRDLELFPDWDSSYIPTDLIFAPTKTRGQPQHDIVSDAAEEMFGGLLYYGTYTRENFSPTGEMALYPTKEEEVIKQQALACYTSQHGINMPHFDAVRGVPEYLSFKQ
jgi:LmbE family N-acetylglucosaminyl deacetylase